MPLVVWPAVACSYALSDVDCMLLQQQLLQQSPSMWYLTWIPQNVACC